MNDILHHWYVFIVDINFKRESNKLIFFSVRKNAEDLKNNLENIVIPMFCSAEISKNMKFITFKLYL